MRVKVNGQIVAVCVKKYIDARQNVAAACGLVLGAWCLWLFLFFRISILGNPILTICVVSYVYAVIVY